MEKQPGHQTPGIPRLNFYNQDGTLRCFGEAEVYQHQKPHTRHCIAMVEELKVCNEALKKECWKISKKKYHEDHHNQQT